jgi:hypothetical protein
MSFFYKFSQTQNIIYYFGAKHIQSGPFGKAKRGVEVNANILKSLVEVNAD